jgi:hypothetical protein
MLALKKKREAEQKAAVEAANSVTPDEATEKDNTNDNTGNNGSNNKVSLLGIGGIKKSNATASNAQKKRTPGEIRIQKGK